VSKLQGANNNNNNNNNSRLSSTSRGGRGRGEDDDEDDEEGEKERMRRQTSEKGHKKVKLSPHLSDLTAMKSVSFKDPEQAASLREYRHYIS
jgi:chromatin remodeling complex protein RSC6